MRGVNFTEEITLIEISENLKSLLKNVVYIIQKIHIPIRISILKFAQKGGGGGQFYKRNRVKKKNRKLAKFDKDTRPLIPILLSPNSKTPDPNRDFRI